MDDNDMDLDNDIDVDLDIFHSVPKCYTELLRLPERPLEVNPNRVIFEIF